MKTQDVEYALNHLLPDGWRLEKLELGAGSGDLIARVRRGRERAIALSIPARVLTAWSVNDAAALLVEAIDAGLGQGRYATTPIIQLSPAWSPYP